MCVCVCERERVKERAEQFVTFGKGVCYFGYRCACTREGRSLVLCEQVCVLKRAEEFVTMGKVSV